MSVPYPRIFADHYNDICSSAMYNHYSLAAFFAAHSPLGPSLGAFRRGAAGVSLAVFVPSSAGALSDADTLPVDGTFSFAAEVSSSASSVAAGVSFSSFFVADGISFSASSVASVPALAGAASGDAFDPYPKLGI